MAPEPKVNILLVDDQPENLLALEAILDGLGQNMVKAHSGAEALRCLLKQDFAAILLDVQMPGMDGFETATLIRQRERSRDTPILFLTAFSASDTFVFKGYAVGAVDYLLKPIEPGILKSKVGVFVELAKKTLEVKQQAAQLQAINAELRKSEEKFRSLSASSPVGIFTTDIEGHCTYTNARYQAICGFTLDVETLHATSVQEMWSRSVHPDDRDRVVTSWYAHILKGQEYSDEFRLLTQSSIDRWVHVRSSPMLCDRGEIIGHVGTVEDISERKQAEAASAQMIREQAARQEAEAANRMKDEFLATLSHELRTPLNSILGWTRLLRTRKFDEKTIARALETLERNARSQAQLIEDILDVSRIIRGKLRLNLCPVNLINVIEAALDAVQLAADDKAIDLKFSQEIPNSELLVNGDPDRLQQVVWNLLSNAIKFTPKEGHVKIRLGTVHDSSLIVHSNQTSNIKNHAQIQVIDTGMGIGKDFLPYVFDRFRQADSSMTRSHGGLGLGLALVHHLVELHGGTVRVDSDGEGKGATFTVELPVWEGSREQGAGSRGDGEMGRWGDGEMGRWGDGEMGRKLSPNTRTPEHPNTPSPCSQLPARPCSLTGLHVLVVDDDADTRDFLTTVLQEHETQVTAVASVSEALEALEKLKPDVLVSDIGMPGEDGYALIRQVRSLEPEQGGNILAIAVTAYASASERKRALAAGFHSHLPKPVDLAELIAVIENFHPRKALISEAGECG